MCHDDTDHETRESDKNRGSLLAFMVELNSFVDMRLSPRTHFRPR